MNHLLGLALLVLIKVTGAFLAAGKLYEFNKYIKELEEEALKKLRN